MTIDPATTVRDIAQQLPSSMRVFEEMGIDYCCGGTKPLSDACRQAGIPLEPVLRKLGALNEHLADPDVTPWQQATLANLIDHVVDTHHSYCRTEIPRVKALLEKVAQVHGARHPELITMKVAFGALSEDMLDHMQKEEQVLFPYIKGLEQTSAQGALPPVTVFGSFARPIECMMRDHEKAGNETQQIRALSNGYTVPNDGCITYRALIDALREYEQDLHRHVHLENNILFPKSLEMETRACALA